jgi:predicted cobalt transporter CbtA
MPPVTHAARPAGRGLWLAHAIAVALGLGLGFDFGRQISGSLLGVVLAINGAVFCSMVVDQAVERWLRWHRGR